MDTTKLIVTLVGFAAIGWVLWFFLLAPARRPGPEGDDR